MQGVPDQFEHPSDAAEFRRPGHREGVELYRAHIVRHAFDPHTHEAYGLGAIQSGVERFRYRGSDHLAPPQSLVLMNPDVLHTGRAETEGGWTYRMVYLDENLVRELSGGPAWHFAQPVQRDAATARRVSGMLAALWQVQDPLAFDGLLLELLNLLRRHAQAGATVTEAVTPGGDARLRQACTLIDDRLADTLTLDELAAAADLSPFHFLRRFKAAYGVTPHQLLMARRLFRAKQLLGAGVAPAVVAADVGLVDQAHLTRRFARMYGVTPARYQQQLGTRPAPRG